MTVKKDADGRRSVQVEVELPGTPEEVWQAIATGPGISSWFVPTTVEERVGGAIQFTMAPGMESPAKVTAWQPPRLFQYEERDWAPGAPPIATEIVVATRTPGHCVVRLVTSLFASGGEWDDQLESIESGWPTYFRVLRLVLGHFRGQPCASLQIMAPAQGSEVEAWNSLTAALGLAGLVAGERRASAPGAPPFVGTAEWVGTGRNLHHALLRLEQPTRGAACINAFTWSGVHIGLNLYFYGPQAAAVVARDEPVWRAWVKDHFAPVGGASGTACS